jgi:aryl-alcohol dehydrogenase-like predicted oxidoreductase
MKLGLGTVQFGLGYGVSNTHGRPSLPEVSRILAQACGLGVETLDTAVAYGEAETVLGQLKDQCSGFRIVSKVPAQEGYQVGAIRSSVEKSLHSIGRSVLDGLLLHRADDLFDEQGAAILAEFEDIREKGYVRKFGVSVYSPSQLERVMTKFTPDIVQLPCNLFDQRFLATGWFERLEKLEVEVHVRSVFLQGLLLMPPSTRPAYFASYQQKFERFDRFCSEHGLSPLQATIGFVRQLRASVALVGANRANELKDIGSAWHAPAPDIDAYAHLSSTEEALILPIFWVN